MRALLVIDVQKGFTEKSDAQAMMDCIKKLIRHFQSNHEPVFFIRHIDETEGSPIQAGTPGADIDAQLAPCVFECIEKKIPSAFYRTELNDKLQAAQVDEVVLTGFNSEYCIFFNSAATFEHGYRVTVIEEACSSVNTGKDYGMDDLDIPEFIYSILDNSGEVNVIELEDFLTSSKA